MGHLAKMIIQQNITLDEIIILSSKRKNIYKYIPYFPDILKAYSQISRDAIKEKTFMINNYVKCQFIPDDLEYKYNFNVIQEDLLVEIVH